MGQLMGEPVLALGALGSEKALTEHDLVARSVGLGRDGSRRRGRCGAGMDPDVREISPKLSFHVGPHMWRQRLSTAPADHIEDTRFPPPSIRRGRRPRGRGLSPKPLLLMLALAELALNRGTSKTSGRTMGDARHRIG